MAVAEKGETLTKVGRRRPRHQLAPVKEQLPAKLPQRPVAFRRVLDCERRMVVVRLVLVLVVVMVLVVAVVHTVEVVAVNW